MTCASVFEFESVNQIDHNYGDHDRRVNEHKRQIDHCYRCTYIESYSVQVGPDLGIQQLSTSIIMDPFCPIKLYCVRIVFLWANGAKVVIKFN